MSVLTIDFEASCLPKHGRSFPIEVGIAVHGQARSWLIRPHRDWWGWDWTAEAEALHGISRERIDNEGLPVEQVLAELSQAVSGHRVVADSRIDQYWLDTLAAAAGLSAPVAIEHVSDLLDEMHATQDSIAQAVAAADSAYPARHRAASDALWLGSLIDRLKADTLAPASIIASALPAAIPLARH